MRLILLLVFIVVPLIELAILIKLGSIFGFWPTFALVIVTALLGTTVLHHQGFAVLKRMQEAVALGRPPVEPVVDGVMLLASGLLLISPGLITDTLGLILLIPPVRHFLARSAFNRMVRPNMTSDGKGPRTTPQSKRPSPGASQNPRRDGQGPVIDGDYERIE